MSDEDTRKRELVKELAKSENKNIVDFAKHLVTVSFSAIGVVLALKEKWLGTQATFNQKMFLGAAIALYLAAVFVAALAAGTYKHRVSLSDYGEVDAELHRVAVWRSRLTSAALWLTLIGTVIIAAVAIWNW